MGVGAEKTGEQVMKVRVEAHLFEPATGLRGVHVQDSWGHGDNEIYDDASLIFWWSEGNGGCNCNRSMDLDRALNRYGWECNDECFSNPDSCQHYSCTHRKIVLERLVIDGREVYGEDE